MASKNEVDASCKLYGGSDMFGRPITMVLIVLMLAFPCVGQRAGGGMHGGGMSMGGPGPGFGGRPGFPNRPFGGQFGFRHFRNFGGSGGLWWGYPGWGYPGWDSPWNCWYWSLDPRGNWCGDSPQGSDPYAGSAKNGYATPIIIQSGAPAAPTPPPEPPGDRGIDDRERKPSITVGTADTLCYGQRRSFGSASIHADGGLP